MSENWSRIKLGDAIDIFDSQRIPLSSKERSTRSGVYPYYGAQGIIDYIDDFIFEGKYLLIAEDGANLVTRNLPIANFADGKFWVNNHAHIIRAKENKADIHYLANWLNFADTSGYITGTAQPKLSQANLKEIILPLPPISTQRAMTRILNGFDTLLENNTRRIKLLEQMAQLIYREWFVDFRFPGHEDMAMAESELGLVPEGWEVTRLGNLAAQHRDSVLPSEVSEDTPYFGLEHIPRKSITLNEWGKASDSTSTKLKFQKGDILFGKIRPYFHKVGVAPFEGICSSDAIVIRPKNPAHFAVVLSVVSSDDFVEHATQTSQGTKMPRANWDVLVDYPVVIPPSKILENFNNTVNSIVSLLQNFIFRNQNLRRTRDMLLPKLISGELDVSALAEVSEPVGEAA